LTGGLAAGYIKPDPPIEVGVTEYENRSDDIAVTVRCVETDALSSRCACRTWRKKRGTVRLDLIERSVSRAELPQ
jgi:hypothetical protein